jgi:outer membrane protein assembly factor BamB
MKRTLFLAALFVVHSAFAQQSGWRADGTGKFPDASPPLEWAKDKGVVWKTPMPKLSNASPVIVGDKLFVLAEPATLLCLNVKDGAILWQKTDNNIADALTPEQKAQAAEDAKKAEPIKEQMAAKRKEMEAQQVEMRKLRELKRQGQTPDEAPVKQKLDQASKEFNELRAQLAPLSKYTMPSTHEANGFSSCTAVADDAQVYVLFGSGIAAAYDHAGERKWIRQVERPDHDWGHSSSPVLAGGKLLIQIKSHHALDPQTGETKWTLPSQPLWGTSVAAKIGDVDVLLSPRGEFIRISDGKLLCHLKINLEYNAPTVENGVVYYSQGNTRAFKLPTAAADTLAPESLWSAKIKEDRYYSSPVIHDGLIYNITRASELTVLDAANGQLVYTKALGLPQTFYPSITLAGKHLFISNDQGTTVVLEPGREYKEVKRNVLEPFRCSPVYAGKRMYVRGFQNMYCIGE